MMLGTKVNFALAVTGVALMSMAGGAVFAHTHDAVATLIAMLAAALALATLGRRAARAFWENDVLGIDDPYGEETRSYKATTRARHLAPKLLRLVRRAKAPVTIIVVGDEHLPGRDGRCVWTEALREAAAAGATVRLYVREDAEPEERERAHAFAAAHPRCRAIEVAPTPHGTFDVLSPVVAWAGERNDPADALLWLEGTREPEATTTFAEYRNARNLRWNRGMLEEYAALVQASGARGT